MKFHKIFVIVGTRPQIIKTQPVIEKIAKKGMDVKIINTGQHYDYKLSQTFFKDLAIPSPYKNLNIGSGTQLEQISKIITKLEKVFLKEKPDFILVPGDTTSALASALAASKCKIKLGHIEAGARSNQFYMAEEINRRIIDHCSNFLFAPTKNCLANIKKENAFGNSFFVGDTMYDLFTKWNLNKFKRTNSDANILVTIHRAENIEEIDNFKKICKVLNLLSNNFKINFPVHPHTQKLLSKYNIKLKFKVLEPFGYFEMMKKMQECDLVITDSGGLQKEAYWMGKPCITIRENTEWIETVNEGANFIMSTSKMFSINKIKKISSIKVRPKGSLFGNGKASEKIAKILSEFSE